VVLRGCQGTGKTLIAKCRLNKLTTHHRLLYDIVREKGEHTFRPALESVPGKVRFRWKATHRPTDVFGVHEQAYRAGFDSMGPRFGQGKGEDDQGLTEIITYHFFPGKILSSIIFSIALMNFSANSIISSQFSFVAIKNTLYSSSCLISRNLSRSSTHFRSRCPVLT